MGTPWYATREQLAEAADIKASASAARTLDSLLRSATENVNGQLVRPLGMWPTVVTWSFDWPADPRSRAWRLWLDERTLISVDSASTGGNALDVSELLLYPQIGPPYTAIETNRGGALAFGGGSTPQGDIVIGGVGGYRNDEEPAGQLAAAVVSTAAVSITVDAAGSAALGVGDLIRIGTERLILTGRAVNTTGVDVAGAGLTANNNSQQLAVADGTAFATGERLLLGAERVQVTEIAGNTLIVKRAVDGSTLAAHPAGEDIFGYRTFVAERGALGTTATTHLISTAIERWVPQALATELCLAEALNSGQQRLSAYARVSGSGDAQRELVGRGLKDIRDDARRALGRRSRVTAV